MALVSNIKDNDWASVRQAIARLGSTKLGPTSTPTYAGLSLTELTTDSLIYTASGGELTSLGVAANGKIPIGSTGTTPVLAEITGTANQITSTAGAGSITLSTPQDIHTGASPTFAGLTINGDITLSNIDDRIIFPNFELEEWNANRIAFKSTASAIGNIWDFMTGDGDATDYNFIYMWGLGNENQATNTEWLKIGFEPSGADRYVLTTEQAGTGTVRPIEISTEGNPQQLWLGTDGYIGMGEGYNPETLLELTHATPTITQHCSTHSDADNSGLAEWITKREDGSGTETASSSVGVSHDGAGADDQLAKRVWKLNTGAGLIEFLRVDSNLDWTLTAKANTDLVVNFAGTTNSGLLTWMEDEDYFKFGDDVVFADGAGLYYGHIYTNSTIAVTITDSTPVEVGDTFTTGEVNGVSFGSSHYLDVGANGAGKYLVIWSMSIAQNSPSAAIQCEQGIMIDGAAQVQGRAHRTIANSTDIGASAGTAIINLTANKQVSLYVANLTNATNIDVEHANLTITQIGGT